MIEISELTKRYRGQTVVDDLSFTVPNGTVTGFVGPNGAGKTTTMRVAVGLDRADGGRALVDGRHLSKHERPQSAIGVVLDASRAPRVMAPRAHLRWLAAAGGISVGRADDLLVLPSTHPLPSSVSPPEVVRLGRDSATLRPRRGW